MSLAIVQSHLQTAGPHVGDLLWWTLTDARISRSHLESIWAGAGLSPAWLPEPPTPERALRAAIRECQVGQHSHLLRLGKEDEHDLVFAIVLETRDGAGNVHHTQEARVRLDRHAPGQLHSDQPAHDLFVAISAAYDSLSSTHTSDDVRRGLLKVLNACAAVTLREHGGVYWTPAAYAETLRRLQTAVAQIGTSRVDIVPIHDTPEGTAALGQAARLSIQEDLAALRAEIDAFLKVPPERASTLTRRLEIFNSLRSKAHLYHSVLKVHVEDLESDLNNLTLQVEGLLNSRAA
jgi:hypothetical protein